MECLKIDSKWDYYKVHSDNSKGWKTVRVKKGNPFCHWCGSASCKHIKGNIGNNEMLNIIYDTLMKNTQFPQWDFNNVDAAFIDNITNIIHFQYHNKNYRLKMLSDNS